MPPSAANTLKRQQTVLSVSDEALKTGDKNVGAGSLHVDDDELAAAFDFFDVEGRGKLTVADLKARLGAFYKNLPSKEYKALISEPNFTKETLRALLANNELGNYDPVKEAFKVGYARLARNCARNSQPRPPARQVYDPQGTGFVDHETLRSIFENLGYGEITDEDLAVLVETADADGDGKISLDDFRGMLSMSKERLQGDAATAPP